MAGNDYKFEGWLAHDLKGAEGGMVWQDFEPKPWEETDIDIRVTHSGICGSDIAAMSGGWGPPPFPICVGHEIVGVAVRVGSQAEGGIKIGDRVGVGSQADACLGRFGRECEACASGSETYCRKMVITYMSKHFNGGMSMGGHATHHRCPSHFVIKIPDGVGSAAAAPMLCGGATMFTPLRHHGCGPDKAVGIVGVGGLGHFGILFAKAMGAKRVVGISRSESKRDEVMELGADGYIATADEKDWASRHDGTLDLIISTTSSSKAPNSDYMRLLRTGGTFVQVGNPDDGQLSVPYDCIINRCITVTGSVAGTPSAIRDMLQLAADKKVRVWAQERPMRDANQAMVDMAAGRARFRYVLTN